MGVGVNIGFAVREKWEEDEEKKASLGNGLTRKRPNKEMASERIGQMGKLVREERRLIAARDKMAGEDGGREWANR